ncbi:MAG: thiamine phosphate synthase [Propionibacteriaceae bacterium]
MTALTGLDMRMRLSRLYLCTDARRRQGDLADFLQAVFAGGVDIVQIRQKGMSAEEELAALQLARTVAASYQGLVAVNDSAELAGSSRADVLHLGQDDGNSEPARRWLSKWSHIGRSTHGRDQVDSAIDDPDVDYFCVGPVWATPTKPEYRPVGLELIRYAAEQAPTADIDAKPWWAIGGICLDTIDDVIAAGARRVVVVRAITEADDPQHAAEQLRAKLVRAWTTPEMKTYTAGAVAGTSKLVRG